MSGNKSNPLPDSRITGTRVKIQSQKNEEDCPSTKRVSENYRTDFYGEYNYWLPKMLE
jgi:hypothetical protein